LDAWLKAQVERVVVVLVVVSDSVLVDRLVPVLEDRNGGSSPVVALSAEECDSSASGSSGRVGEVGLEGGRLGVEGHAGESTLGVGHVGSGEGADLPGLESAVIVVEALGAGTSRGRQVFVCLELPVGPSSKVLVCDITDLVDLLSACGLSEASAELGKHEGDTKTLGILGSRSKPVLVPSKALISMSDLWLTAAILALLGVHLAAVSMVIEHVSARTNFTTWRGLEANWEDKTSSDAEFVREWDRFKPHLLRSVMALVLFVDLRVHGCQVLLVHVSGDEEHWVSSRVGRVGLVKWIVANNVWLPAKRAET